MAYNFKEKFSELLPGGFWPAWISQMPFTDFHQMNLDWITRAVKAVLDQMKYYFIDGGSKETIEEVMEEHPEWWPRVMDGAITSAQINSEFLKEIENAYVTPEMFGAVGDGVADDTQAMQAALNTGPYVIAFNKYKITSVELENVKLDLRGEIIGECVIHHNSTIEGGTITQTTDDPCVKFQNTATGDSHLQSYLIGTLLKPTRTGIGIKLQADDKAMCFAYITDVAIKSTGKAIYIENNNAWITKCTFTNVTCNSPTYAIYLLNARPSKVNMGDIVFKDVTAQYYQNKPVDFLHLEQGNCVVTLYNSFVYDGIGNVKYYLNDAVDDTKITLYESGNENDTTLTNKTNLRFFFFSPSAAIYTVDYRKASQAVLPPIDYNGGGYFESFNSPSVSGRFEGLLMRGGAGEATGATNHIFGISFHRGRLAVLRNTTPDIATSQVVEVTTPYSGAIYTTDTLPYGTARRNGATCWCSDIKMPVTYYDGYWYKPDGTQI